MPYELDRPIFVVGTGRCGSTILNKILSEHPNLSFFTTATTLFPSWITFQRVILSVWDKPLLGSLLRLRLIAGEAWPFWDQYIPGFSRCFLDFRATDVTNIQKQRIQNDLYKLLTKKRHRLLIKFTGWTRIGFIKEVFPDAKIIHITRDPRAVVNSILHVNFWTGRLGPYHLNGGFLTPTEMEIWNSYNQSFIALAVIEYKRVLNMFHESLQTLPQNAKHDVLDISYNQLCLDPKTQINRVLEFCGLEKNPKFMKLISKYELKNQNDKWKTNLTSHQKQELETVLQDLDLTHFSNL